MSRPDGGLEIVFLEPEVLLDETAVRTAWVEHDSEGVPIVRVHLSRDGAERFAAITDKYLNSRIGFLYYGRLLNAPVIRDRIEGGELVLGWTLTENEAADVAKNLNASVAR